MSERLADVAPYEAAFAGKLDALQSQLAGVAAALQLHPPAPDGSDPWRASRPGYSTEATPRLPREAQPALSTVAESAASGGDTDRKASGLSAASAGDAPAAPAAAQFQEVEPLRPVPSEHSALFSSPSQRFTRALLGGPPPPHLPAASLPLAYASLLEAFKGALQTEALRVVELAAENRALNISLKRLQAQSGRHAAGAEADGGEVDGASSDAGSQCSSEYLSIVTGSTAGDHLLGDFDLDEVRARTFSSN